LVEDDLKIVTIKEVKKGEELTYSYNTYIEENEDIEDFLWDPRWNFECKCGSKNCQKIIQGYKK
jgi:SET domain-containing protein